MQAILTDYATVFFSILSIMLISGEELRFGEA
jgi:hypothetical protein